MVLLQAHKGVSTENPENTMPAFIAAVEQGYSTIELDVGVTADMKFVLMHDSKINRTARDAEGGELPVEKLLSEITYEEAAKYDYGSWFSKKFKGTPLPLFSEVMEFAREKGISLKIDNKYLTFTKEQRAAFFELIKPYQDVCQLTCYTPESLTEAVREFPDMTYHYDGLITDEVLGFIGRTVPRERITIWLPMRTRGTTWVRIPFADEETAGKVKQYGRLGLWILLTYDELREAERLGADIVETNGQIKPTLNAGIMPDMHTHSEHSHDSATRLEDLCLAEIGRGTQVMALTDHFDTFAYTSYDVYSPILAGYEEIQTMSGKYGDKCLFLSGVEIGEGFWFPEEQKKILSLVDYDVILGSVHFTRSSRISVAYSHIDFSALTDEEIHEFLNSYFDDILKMLDSLDFDILCHLYCPIRYIEGKYGRKVDITLYDEKVKQILATIIKRGIALEVNTTLFVGEGIAITERLLNIYREMGGYLITLASDAHVPENAARDFEVARALLLGCGFRNVGYFENRKFYQCNIGDN